MIFLILLIVFIWVTVDDFRIPKPKQELIYKKLQEYYGGWKRDAENREAEE